MCVGGWGRSPWGHPNIKCRERIVSIVSPDKKHRRLR